MGVVVLFGVGVGAGAFFLLRGSLPPLDGRVTVTGVDAPVMLERDARGIAVIHAGSEADAHFALGLAHGQDRFFQMDLVRRLMGGTLAELVGPAALGSDEQMRRYGYAEAAGEHLDRLPPEAREALDRYVAGVNAGLASLRVRPPEYLGLRTRPEPWSARDALLTYLNFYHSLSTHYREEARVRELHRHLPAEVAAFLTPEASRFDRPVPGLEGGDPRGGYSPTPIPGPEVIDLRDGWGPAGAAPGAEPLRAGAFDPFGPSPRIRIYADLPGGSNAWAVGTLDGEGALVAGDPHLPMQVPGIWYRAEWHLPEGSARGLSVPGIPGFLLALTDHLAWSPTAALVDQTDLVEIEPDTADPTRYQTEEGTEPFGLLLDTLHALRAEARIIERRTTRWGPVIMTTPDGVPLALRSPAFDPGGLTLGHLEMTRVRSVAEALEVMRRIGGPGLGVVVGDREGTVGWGVTGFLPAREGLDGRLPMRGADPETGWPGARPEAERPLVIDSAGGHVFSANHRFAELEEAGRFSGMWLSPTRAWRIAELLEREHPPDERYHQQLQLDLVSPKHLVVRELVLGLLTEEVVEGDALLEELRELVRTWNGTADADTPHFGAMEAGWRALRGAALAPLLGLVWRENPGFVYTWPLAHEAALRILEERPEHLLPTEEGSWDEVLVRALRGIPDEVLRTPWGERNRAAIRHPFSGLLPVLAPFLDLPADPLHGWPGVIRAQGPAYGQSVRFVARPGRPEAAILDLPGGQSGHPLSRWYREGHEEWVTGWGGPLLAGEARHRLHLEPGG